MTSASSLQVAATYVRGLSLETNAILARDFKGSKLFAKKGSVPFQEHKGQPAQILEAPPFLCKSLLHNTAVPEG